MADLSFPLCIINSKVTKEDVFSRSGFKILVFDILFCIPVACSLRLRETHNALQLPVFFFSFFFSF